MSGERVSAGKTKWRSEKPVIGSRITWRILAINIFALAVLVVGLLYVGKYRQELIESEIKSLMIRAEMFAAALGEAAVGGKKSGQQFLEKKNAVQIIRRLAAATHTNAQLVSKEGQILIDSRLLAGLNGLVQIEELPPPSKKNNFTHYLLDAFDQFLLYILRDYQVPDPNILPSWEPATSSEARRAMAGEYAQAVRRSDSGLLSISVAVPVQHYKHVLGAVILTRNTSSIDNAVFEVRLEILKMFGIAFLVTVLLSIYLAGTIARPIQRLAAAANLVRQGLNRQYSIPDLGHQTDEIGHLNAALIDMTEALWERIDAIERFAADVTHEIRNPLTSLRSAVETAAKIKDPEQQEKLIAIILDDIQRLDRLISDISDASRLDSELSHGKMERVDMRVLLSTLRGIHYESQEADGTKLSLEIAGNTPIVVLGLRDRIVQILRNLVSNAESFSPPNGTITVKAEMSDQLVVITIDDEGPGITEGSENDIFNRFYQERPPGEKFGTHSGLGLSISKQIVESHGGTIWAENRNSNTGDILGARFIFQLPAINYEQSSST